MESNGTDCDDLNVTMLHICLPDILNHTTHCKTLSCLDTDVFPTNWKVVIITPVVKITEKIIYSTN